MKKNKTSIATYAVRIHKKRSEDYEKLDSFNENNDFLTFIEEVLSESATTPILIDSLNTAIKADIKKSGNRRISGIVKSGKRGIKSDIIDTESFEQKYTRGIKDAELIPFYFSFYVPANSQKGFFVSQKFGIYGFKTAMDVFIKAKFKAKFPGYVLRINPEMPYDQIAEYFEGKSVKKIQLISRTVPTDATDEIDGMKEEDGTLKVVISANRNKSIPIMGKLISKIRNEESPKDFIEFRGLDYQNIKIDVDENGSTKTYDWLNPNSSFFDENITNKIEFDKNNNPVFTDIDDIVEKKLKIMNEEE